ncbi:chemotaxis protein CheD [Niallia circulans]|uniref:Probable chemoreceptor glutamine deamidase CheD n=2 Tax=Niallia circulans TaxID=1397 RepID=A0A0J1LHM7_NIACI|nr:chemotaxis protein CheD [Niallia circulans]KLV28580.1 chemotaxis protein CheD [Niallia circulans]MDR4315565.1 chemotaxis protein CheD [Niallia circulans]MED3837188.1 chemotaxis protein CheD [Niallia circulans]MED4244258.1 chemotaxis protein CheD [Niallia circulans]MED4249009.1 chemotaxis protein CheD [Niallia circulans]
MTDQITVIKVGIADMNVVESPNTIRTSGLGSCVGIVLYSSLKPIAGLAHIMLPEASISKSGTLNKAKFADTAIVELVERLEGLGLKRSTLLAKIAGGAQMFQFTGTSDVMRIGPRNVEAVKNTLQSLRIKLVSEDVGGNSGRTIEFCPATHELTIRTVNKGIHII